MRECSLGVCVTAREQSLGSSLRCRQQSFLRQVWSSPSRSGWQVLGLEAHHTQLLKMWVSGIKLKFSCLQGKLFTDWAIFLAQYFRCIRDNGHCWRKAFEQGDCGLLYFFPWRWLLLHTQSWLHDMVGDCMFIFPFPKQLSQGKWIYAAIPSCRNFCLVLRHSHVFPQTSLAREETWSIVCSFCWGLRQVFALTVTIKGLFFFFFWWIRRLTHSVVTVNELETQVSLGIKELGKRST